MLASTRRKKSQKTAQRISLSLDNRGPHKCSGAVKRHCLRPVACQVVLPAYFCVATCCAQGVFRAVEPASCLWPWTWLSYPVQSSPRRAALGRLHPDGANGVDYIWYKRPGSSRQICCRLYPAGSRGQFPSSPSSHRLSSRASRTPPGRRRSDNARLSCPKPDVVASRSSSSFFIRTSCLPQRIAQRSNAGPEPRPKAEARNERKL